MPATFYNLLHFLGIFLLVTGLAGVAFHAANGGTKGNSKTRRLASTLHGLGAVLILVSGFGSLAKLGIMSSLPGWAWAKIVVWLVLGGLIVLPYRRPQQAGLVAVLVPLLAFLAAYLAIYKPF